MQKKFDRGVNPNDGSRKRLKSEEHKTVKDYKRFSKSDLHKLINNRNIEVEDILKNLDEGT